MLYVFRNLKDIWDRNMCQTRKKHSEKQNTRGKVEIECRKERSETFTILTMVVWMLCCCCPTKVLYVLHLLSLFVFWSFSSTLTICLRVSCIHHCIVLHVKVVVVVSEIMSYTNKDSRARRNYRRIIRANKQNRAV